MKLKAVLIFTLACSIVYCKSPKSDDERSSYVLGLKLGSQIGQLKKQKVEFDRGELLKGIEAVMTGKAKADKQAFRTAQMAYQKDKKGDNQKRMSYHLGTLMGQGFKVYYENGVKIDTGYVDLGIDDGIAGKSDRLKSEEMSATQKYMRNAQMKGVNKNKADGKKFLDENAKKPGVKTTKSGLQYKVITRGSGRKPKATDTVTVHYKGTLLDGSEFDSSYKRGQPASFALNRVIAGWTEGLQLMRKGEKTIFYIPSNLGYGDGGNPSIPGGSVLIFEVELQEIK